MTTPPDLIKQLQERADAWIGLPDVAEHPRTPDLLLAAAEALTAERQHREQAEQERDALKFVHAKIQSEREASLRAALQAVHDAMEGSTHADEHGIPCLCADCKFIRKLRRLAAVGIASPDREPQEP